jgi:hypothetical protein
MVLNIKNLLEQAPLIVIMVTVIILTARPEDIILEKEDSKL